MANAAKKESKDAQNVIAMGGNLTNVLDKLATAKERILQIEKEVKALNDEKKAIREGVEALGIGKRGFDNAFTYSKMSPEQREGYDDSYRLSREAFGMPIKDQLDLFKSDKKA